MTREGLADATGIPVEAWASFDAGMVREVAWRWSAHDEPRGALLVANDGTFLHATWEGTLRIDGPGPLEQIVPVDARESWDPVGFFEVAARLAPPAAPHLLWSALDVWFDPYGDLVDRNIASGFEVERVRRIAWSWHAEDHFDFGALLVDDLGWHWYARGIQSRSLQFQDHSFDVTGPVDALRAFDPLFVPAEDAERNADAFELARRRAGSLA